MDYPNNYISVIGAGSWGTTLASLLADKGYDVTLWTRETDLAEQINKERINNLYLPDIALSHNLKATNDIAEAVSASRYIVNVVPTQYVRPVFTQAKQYIKEESIIISAAKGIEIETLSGFSADHPFIHKRLLQDRGRESFRPPQTLIEDLRNGQVRVQPDQIH